MTTIEKSGLVLYMAGLAFLILIVLSPREPSMVDFVFAIGGILLGSLTFIIAGKDREENKW